MQAGHWFRELEGTAVQSQEPVLRSCHTYFIGNLTVLKLPASVSRAGPFPAWSWQDKNPNERGWGSDAQRAKGKALGFCLPKMSPFWRTCSWDFGFLNVSKAGSRPGEPEGRVAVDGADALCVEDQGPEVRSLEGRRAGALCTFTTVDKQQPVYFAPIIPFLTNLFGY